ncbi:glutamine transport system permease protein [Geomicrobium halophilum]|uniref:Glutamine transport system permease protein n=1 Tax=Geomicrobium halophilum TaxID=549000 RepID=A0A841PQR5_9BACL|nr:amino acid ABC transporter permease [Geomicrobium halophilum]MBB6451130.1 glutamine transport system permease protein [Geomicrobium halophilum]
MNLNPEAFVDIIPYLVTGLWYTLIITLVGVALGCVLGTIFGLMRLSKNGFIKAIASIYVEVLRGTPLLAQIFFFHFGIPNLLGFNLDALVSAIVVIAINSGAYIAEIVRGGVQSVDQGQIEAGRSLGLNSRQTMRYIIWPQALKIMIPPFGNQFIISLKDTSLLSSIAVAELMYQAQTYSSITFDAFEAYFMVCLFYLMITIPASLLLRYTERRLERS